MIEAFFAAASLACTAPDRPRLVAEPAAAGPTVELFNGRDLADWDAWLGYQDPGLTYQKPPVAPLGETAERWSVFKVVEEDGAPAIFVGGRTWGSLTRRGSFANYRLTVEYKWGPGRFAPRETLPPNNGLLYHVHGERGTVWGTWSPAVEFEIMYGSTGMIVPVGEQVSATVKTVRDDSLIQPHLRFSPRGTPLKIMQPNWNAEAVLDAEKPQGVWNRLDLYVVGDRAVHVVNGVPVMDVRDMRTIGPDGRERLLTEGAVELQSEGAETYFRRLTLTPIQRLPEVNWGGC